MSDTPRLLITGSRAHQWTPYDSHALLIAVQDIVDKTQKNPIIVHGGATGADTEAALHGQRLFGLQTEVHRADWKKYGRAAGPIRNKQMVEQRAGIPVLVVWNQRLWVYNPNHPTHGTYRTLDPYTH